ncbi:Uncharacterised protein [Bacillus freudenreichii]|nr:Uncharacterised protein [Bacillus freudenreichii]
MSTFNSELVRHVPIINIVRNRDQLISLTEDFQSENALIDDWIKHLSFAYEHHRLGLVSTTLIMYKSKLIGFYSARVYNLEAEDQEVKKFLDEGMNIPAVEITHFAIHKDYSRQGVGTGALAELIGDLMDVNNYAAIRYLFCWATKNKETLNFYEEKNGFIRMKTERDDNTILMRFPIPDLIEVADILNMVDDVSNV